MDEIEAQGFAYDSSALPSPSYYLTKLAVLMAYRLARRPSASLLGDWRSTRGPDQPYRPGRDPYEKGNRKLVELPISVCTPLRLPLTGQGILMAPSFLRRRMQRSLEKQSSIVVNLHGMDLLDPQRERLPTTLQHRQPELQRPIGERLSLLKEFLELLARDRPLRTCESLARKARV